MAFFSREVIRPEVMQPYGPYEDLSGQLNQAYDTAQNRSSQRINQMYANVGMSPRGAPATSARARSATDIENQRAQQQYSSYYDWLKGKQLVSPQILPSGASTLASPFLSGIGQAAGPGIVSGAVKGLGSAYDWMMGGFGDGGGGDYASSYGGYGGAGGNWGEPGDYGGWDASAFDSVSPFFDAGGDNYGAYADVLSELGGFI